MVAVAAPPWKKRALARSGASDQIDSKEQSATMYAFDMLKFTPALRLATHQAKWQSRIEKSDLKPEPVQTAAS